MCHLSVPAPIGSRIATISSKKSNLCHLSVAREHYDSTSGTSCPRKMKTAAKTVFFT